MTLRLSSACSNQLSYRPKYKVYGGKGIQTPDIQLAKLALYQLSYTPVGKGFDILPWHFLFGKCREHYSANTGLCELSS